MSKPANPFDEALWAASDGPRLLTELQDLTHQIRLFEAKRSTSIPPKWLDPAQHPRRNTLHHLQL